MHFLPYGCCPALVNDEIFDHINNRMTVIRQQNLQARNPPVVIVAHQIQPPVVQSQIETHSEEPTSHITSYDDEEEKEDSIGEANRAPTQ